MDRTMRPDDVHSSTYLSSKQKLEYSTSVQTVLEAGEDILPTSDDEILAKLGYKAEFRREFTNLSTISFAFSILGLTSSIATTFDTPMLLGGPASVVWCWFIGSIGCICISASIAEIVSAYPVSGGCYSCLCFLTPSSVRSSLGWIVAWLNLLGQIACVASVEFGVSRMIWAGVVIGYDGEYEVSQAKIVGLFIGLLVFHGIYQSMATKTLAAVSNAFIFVNLGSALATIIALLVSTSQKQPAAYIFGNVVNLTGWSSNGFAFLLGLLSVQWTMTDYDATAHISEEVKKAAVRAPAAILMATIGTGLFGWVLNIILVMCSGDITLLPGPTGLSFAAILLQNVGKKGALAIWAFVALNGFFCASSCMQSNARQVFAFSRDRGLPDKQLFGKMAPNKIPVYAVWLVVLCPALLGLLDLASPIATNAVFSITAVALDASYGIAIVCKMIYKDHPEVQFKPGPFSLGTGWFAFTINFIAVTWIVFVAIILSMPTIIPVTAANMNYAAPITAAVMLISGLWYVLQARKFYKGPERNLSEVLNAVGAVDTRSLSDEKIAT